MKSIYESGGKRWSGLIEGQMKDEIASAAAENPARAIAPQWEGLVDSIISAIVALIKEIGLGRSRSGRDARVGGAGLHHQQRPYRIAHEGPAAELKAQPELLQRYLGV